MGLATRVIPTLLCRGRQLVKGKQFNGWRSVGVAAQAVRIHQQRGVDELVLLDIGATPENRGPDLKLVEELTADCFMPLAVGGGIRTLADVKALLRAGADKVVIGEAAWVTDVVREVADAVGSQAVVVTCDAVASAEMVDALRPGVRCTREQAAARARWIVGRGAGEIMLTRVELEGTMAGYDLELISAVARAVPVPVIAHGGAGTYQHMLEAVQAGASAVAAGAMFQFTEATPRGAAEFLAAHGVEARI